MVPLRQGPAPPSAVVAVQASEARAEPLEQKCGRLVAAGQKRARLAGAQDWEGAGSSHTGVSCSRAWRGGSRGTRRPTQSGAEGCIPPHT
mmetsp:Transcript_643/g.1452  ORF Transcript_643/g.1452 Transcript_643/m.1452 type:complete len:90 (-) Transcript_643:183-452(-)